MASCVNYNIAIQGKVKDKTFSADQNHRIRLFNPSFDAMIKKSVWYYFPCFLIKVTNSLSVVHGSKQVRKHLTTMTEKNGILNEKVAIITGASSGIGEAIAYDFAGKGALLTLSGINEERLKEVAKKCQSLAPKTIAPLICKGDLKLEKIREDLVKDTVEHFGRIDILVNNAGNFKAKTLQNNLDLDVLDEMLDINLRVPFHLTKLAIPHLIKTKGNIINISSRASFRPVFYIGVEYGIAKSGLDQLTKWTALELGSKGVRANSINPGSIVTNISRHVNDKEKAQKMYEDQAKVHAMGRVGTSEEVAKVASFLVSEDASFITGQNLLVDGGNSVFPALPPNVSFF